MEACEPKTGLVIVDHGSDVAEAKMVVEMFAVVVRAMTGDSFVAVVPAHMMGADPSVDEAFETCVAAGADQVVVGLFFLTPGKHSAEDIPRMAAEAAARHGDIPFVVTEPLGADDRLAEVLLDRIDAAVAVCTPASS